jgi:hypothetical protein
VTIRVIWTRPPPVPQVGVSAMVGGEVRMPLRCSDCRGSYWVLVGDHGKAAEAAGWGVRSCPDGSLLITCPACVRAQEQPLRVDMRTDPFPRPLAGRHAAP